MQGDLAAVPSAIDRIVLPVSIHDAESRIQSFGQVRASFIRVTDQMADAEIARYDLPEDASTETAKESGRQDWQQALLTNGSLPYPRRLLPNEW